MCVPVGHAYFPVSFRARGERWRPCADAAPGSFDPRIDERTTGTQHAGRHFTFTLGLEQRIGHLRTTLAIHAGSSVTNRARSVFEPL
jgi:hypothetical protein